MGRTAMPSVKDHNTFKGTYQLQQRNAFDGKPWDAVVRKLFLLVVVTAGFLLSPLVRFPFPPKGSRGGQVETSDSGIREKSQFQWSHIPPSRELRYHDCFDGLQCARLEVPMDHKRTDGKGRTVAIALAKLPAKVPVTDPRYGGAILINPGGPGGSGVAQLLESGRNLQTIADSEVEPEAPFDETSPNLPKYFDIIGFDPRGVNNTTPGFSCFPDMFSRRNWELQKEADGMLGSSDDSLMRNWQRNKALAEGCSEQISAKIDGQEEALGEHMNTSPVVQDMIEIIERHAEWRERQGIAQQRAHDSAKGFDKDQPLARRTRWDRGNEKLLYWGRSYGTVLGATFAAMYPDRVERAVLDGVVDLDSYYFSKGPSSVLDADVIFDRFAIYCDAAGPDGCGLHNSGGPDSIKTSVRDLLSSIRNSSVLVPASATRGPEVVTWTDVMILVRIATYQPLYFFPLLAELLGDLSKGNGSAIADFKQRNREPSCLSSECLLAGPYSRECTIPGENDEYATAAILCTDAENLGKIDQDEFKQHWHSLKAGSEMLGDYWAHVRLSCVGWKAKAKWRFTGPFTGNTSHPLLFVSNTLDPVTPLRSARKMSSNFPGSVVLQQDSEGHTILAAPSLCVAKAIRAYFQTGELPQPGMIYQADMKPLLGAPSSLSSSSMLDLRNLSAADRILYAAVEDEVRKYRRRGRFLPLGSTPVICDLAEGATVGGSANSQPVGASAGRASRASTIPIARIATAGTKQTGSASISCLRRSSAVASVEHPVLKHGVINRYYLRRPLQGLIAVPWKPRPSSVSIPRLDPRNAPLLTSNETTFTRAIGQSRWEHGVKGDLWPCYLPMEMDHHVSPDATTSANSSISHDSCQPRRSSRGSSPFYPHSPPSPPALPQVRSEKPFSLQARRLQLRNAGFRGARLSLSPQKVSLPRNVSDQFSSWRSLSGSSDTEDEEENQPASPTGSDSARETGSVRRKVNVLQEIHNSSRGQQSRRSSVSSLFRSSPEDTGHRHFLSSSPSPVLRPSVLSSPSISDDDSDAESVVISRDQSPPGSPPLSLRDQLGGRKRDSRTRKSSYETRRYIEHLETQLAAAQSQLSPMQSPSSRPQASKLRSLNAEIKVLKQEIAEWESKFEARIREEVTARTEVETKLKARIRALENQVELDACRIKELEYEKEIQAQKLRDAESLKSTNRSLERRIDVLTELLAQTPARAETPRSPVRGSDAVSPSRSPGPRLSRPRSMVPSITLTRRESWFQPMIVPDADEVHGQSPLHELAAELDSSRTRQSDSQPVQADSVPELDFDASTVSSTSASKSQRSSAMSQFSSVSSQWGLPFPFSGDFHGKTHSRHRSMRRFPSGTCTLKPLILPAATAQASDCPPQQSLYSDFERSPTSFDPTQIDEGPEEETGDSAHSMAQQETLDALEGRTDHYTTFDEAILKHGERLSDFIPPENPCSDDGYSSLRQDAGIDDGSLTCFSPGGDVDVLPYATTESMQEQSHSPTVESTDITRSPMSARMRIENHKLRSDNKMPKTCAREYKSSNASTPRIIGQAAEILFNFCDRFKGFKSRFGALARRIIATVWNRSVRRFGKLSWWILGLLVGSQTRRAWFKRTPSILAADNYEWHRYSGAREAAYSGPHSVSCEDREARTCPQPAVQQKQHEILPVSAGDRPAHGKTLGHSLCLWAKFSVAIVVAIGLAIRHGPGSLLEGDPPDRAYTNEENRPGSPVRETQTQTQIPSHPPDDREKCHADESSNVSGSVTVAVDDTGPPSSSYMDARADRGEASQVDGDGF